MCAHFDESRWCTPSTHHLLPWTSGELRYKDYVKSRTDKSLPVIGSKALFLKIWGEHTEIECHGACGHAVCVECGEIAVERDRLENRTDDEAVRMRAALDLREESHGFEHKGERRYAEDCWFQGETYSHRMTTIRIDAPTQHQFELPRQKKVARDVVKSLDNAQRWSSKITGAQVAGMGMFAFVARAALGGGPNLTCTVLMVVLSRLVASGFTLGLRLMLVLDNTTGENKCHAVIAFLGWLVYFDHFREAGFFCMLVGHTFNELDQSFNTLILSMLQYAIYTVSQMVGLIRQFLLPYGIRDVTVLDHLWDVSGVLLPHCHPLSGFATSQHGDGMHEFRIKKDNAGTVRLHMRKSSQASGWEPEGPGFEIFKSTPPTASEFVAAAFKLDSAWHRKEVEATLRQWFPFMAVSDQMRETFHEEWTSRCFSLPTDMQPHQFPPEKIMKMPELPVYTSTERNDAILRAPNPSARLENPIVNPTFGGAPGHRTRADVQNETAAYRQTMRQDDSSLPPIFLSDYILVQLPGRPLALHQVCNGALLEQATAEKMTFTTVEYAHSPQQGVPGLWGTFSKLENTSYNPLDKKSGTKFVRHSAIGRSHVVVYDVQVFVNSAKKLCIKTQSLRQLASKRPAEHAVPASIPASHGASHSSADNNDDNSATVDHDSATVDNDADPDDDPPAPIPNNYTSYAWDDRSCIQEFLLWSKLGRQRNPTWHRGNVVRVLEAEREDGFTHDAKFDGERNPRGTTLTAEACAEGVLILIKLAAPAAPAPTPAPEPTLASDVVPARSTRRRS